MNERIYLSPPDMSGDERERLLNAFDSNWIAPLGPEVDAFEREFAEYVGVPHAVALSSGTAALHLALQLVGAKRGDRVLTSTLTFVATANAIRYCGAEPVFIDSEENSWNMDPQLLSRELEDSKSRGQLPKAVVTVDAYGQAADYDSIVPICQDFQVPLIEDAAESLGARYRGKMAGAFGECAAFSFNGNKIITTSGGGMLVTHSRAAANQARHLATQARDPVPHYQHSTLGYNYRLSNLLAAVGRGQLSHLDDKVLKRRQIFERYRQHLAEFEGIHLMPQPEGWESTRWLTVITVDECLFGCGPEQIRLALEEQNIEARPTWKPMHLQPLYANQPAVLTGVSERLFTTGLCLPSGSSLTESQQLRVIETFEKLHRRYRNENLSGA